MIKVQKVGLPTSELCRKRGLSPATFYKPKAKYGWRAALRNAAIQHLGGLTGDFGPGASSTQPEVKRERLPFPATRAAVPTGPR